MERIELDFEGDTADASSHIESMVRILDRLEGRAERTARALDSMDVDLEDDIAQVLAMTAAEERLERQAAATNRELMKRAGLRWVPGGGGGGGGWQVPGGGPEDARSAAYTTRRILQFDDFSNPRMSWAAPPGFSGSGGPYIPSQTSMRDHEANLGRGILGGFGGFGGGGRGRAGGGGFFSYGDSDGSFQAGDLVRGILPGAQRAGPGALGVLGAGAVGLGGLLGPGAALGGVGAAGMISALAANVAVLATAFGGLGDAIDGDKEAFDKLTPSAQAFVQVVRGFIPELKGLQETIREGVLPGAANGLNALFSPDMIRALESGLPAIAKGLGDQLFKAGGFLGSGEETKQLEAFLKNSVGWTSDLTDATLSLFDAWTTLLTVGSPFIDWMTEGIAKGAEWVNTMIDQKVATGEMVDLMERGQTTIEQLGDAIGSILGFLKALADVMDGPVGNALGMAGDALDELAAALVRNQAEIEAFINGGLAALANMIQFLWPLFTTTIEGINAVAEAFGGWESVFEIILGAVVIGKFAALAGAIASVGVTAGIVGAEAGGLGLLATRLKFAAGSAVALKLAFDKLFDLGGGDFNEWSNRIGAAIVNALPIPQNLKDALAENTITGGNKIDPKTGKVIPSNPGAPSTGGKPDEGTRGPGALGPRGNLTAPTSWKGTHVTDGLDLNSGAKTAGDMFFVDAGTPIGAPEAGTIMRYDPEGAQGGGSIWFKADSGPTYWFGHITIAKGMHVGKHVEKGETIMVLYGAKGFKTHLHIDKSAKVNVPAADPSSPWSGGAPAFEPDKSPPAIPSGDALLTDAERTALAVADRSEQKGKRTKLAGTNLSFQLEDTFADNISLRRRIVARLKADAKKTDDPELKANIEEMISRLDGEIGRAIDKRRTETDAAIDRLQARLKVRVDAFRKAFAELRAIAVEQFDKITDDFIAPSAKIAAAERTAKDDADLERQLAEAEKALLDAKAGTTRRDSDRIVAEAQTLLGTYALANEIDKAQSAVLGIAHVDQFGEDFANKMRDTLAQAAAGGVDEEAIRGAEQRISDIRFTIRQRSLLNLAAEEEKDWKARRELERLELEDSLDRWEAYYMRRVKLGMNPQKAADAAMEAAGAEMRLPGYAPGPPQPPSSKPILMPGFFAEGGVAERPTLGVFGERGREALIPLDDPRYKGLMGGANVQVTIANGMEWLADFIDVRVVDSVDSISQEQGRTADMRFRGGRY